MGKGSTYRPVDKNKFDENFDNIFPKSAEGKKPQQEDLKCQNQQMLI